MLKAPEYKQRELIPENNYHGICYCVCDMGTHSKEYMGQTKMVRQLLLGFELTNLRHEVDGADMGPKVISTRETFSMHEKATLRKLISTWRGKGLTQQQALDFDFEKLLSKTAIIQVLHKESKAGKTYQYIAGITCPQDGVQDKQTENDLIFFTFGMDFPESMHDWIREEIKKSEEYKMISDAANDEHNPENIEEWDGDTDEIP